MKKEEIIPFDLKRLLFGQAPPEFILEVFMRTIIIFLILLVIVRFMGKRMGGQLTISELAVMITLGAIVSPGMQMPQTGVLLAIMILVCALIFQRGSNVAEYKSAKFEETSQGKLSILVKDGVMNLDEMSKTKVSRQQLFSAIRSRSIYNLGEVDRVYLEACGIFSIYTRKEPKPGLVIFPPSDNKIGSYQLEISAGHAVCAHCGNTCKTEYRSAPCDVCGSTSWQDASISIPSMLNADQA